MPNILIIKFRLVIFYLFFCRNSLIRLLAFSNSVFNTYNSTLLLGIPKPANRADSTLSLIRISILFFYKQYLPNYIEETIVLGATPILATAMCRKYFGGVTITRKERHDLGKLFNVPASDHIYYYSYAMEEVAIEQGVDLIDLTSLTKNLLESYGDAESAAQLFVSLDVTHPNALGATLVARLCAKEMSAQNILAEYIHTETDLLINPNDVDFEDAYTGKEITEELTIMGLDLEPATGTFTLSVSDEFLISTEIGGSFTSSIHMNYTNSNLEFLKFYISVPQSSEGNLADVNINGIATPTALSTN